MRDYRGLEVWEKAHRLTVQIYRSTETFPKAEQFGLTSQIRRSSSAIPTNIAEGCGRRSQAELAQFLHVAIGSANELEYQLLLSEELGYLNSAAHTALEKDVASVRQMLSKLVAAVRGSDPAPRRRS
ncbi:MAG TPA: four helix bundle protein [Anaerolineales bacterium]